MSVFLANLEETALQNTYFRRVLHTSKHTQLVVMAIPAGEDIGVEVHQAVDQFIRVEAGEGKLIINTEEKPLKAGDAFIIPAGTQHNVLNTSAEKPLKLYTLYSPPHHRDGVVHKTKQEAAADQTDHI